MSDILWRRGNTTLSAFGAVVACSCEVRNLENERRHRDEVVFTTRADGKRGEPYSPHLFPVGKWEVGAPLPESHPYMAPYFIPTNAWQTVKVWEIEERDKLYYLCETEEWVNDWAYGLHCSTSMTTLGCIRIAEQYDLLRMVEEIKDRLSAGAKVTLEVV